MSDSKSDTAPDCKVFKFPQGINVLSHVELCLNRNPNTVSLSKLSVCI